MVSSSLLAPEGAARTIPEIDQKWLTAHIQSEIARLHGPQLPVWNQDQILAGFWERFGPDGRIIADRVFGVHDGFWQGAPVTVLRFQASHDKFFSLPLLAEARDVQGDH